MTSDSKKEFDFLIYIGRFQPLHLGHEHIIRTALEKSKRVILQVGSANQPISYKNSWSYEQRVEMIEAAFADVEDGRIIIMPCEDILYNDTAWLGKIQRNITDIILAHGNNHGFQARGTNDFKIGVIGFNKDESSYYLNMFPQWEQFLLEEQWGTVNATQIRENYFERAPRLPHDLCSEPVVEYLRKHMLSKDFKYVLHEYEEIAGIKDKWRDAPYTPHFCTTDAVICQSGHVLLHKRTEGLGIGLLALVGRHVHPDQGGAFDNCLNEIYTETKLSDKWGSVPRGKIKSFYTGKQMQFDDPKRDPRGFYSTSVFGFNLPNGDLYSAYPKNGDGDIGDWYPIGTLRPEEMFLDHYFIIQQMLNSEK